MTVILFYLFSIFVHVQWFYISVFVAFLCSVHFCIFLFCVFVDILLIFGPVCLFIAVLHFYLTITHLISFSKFAPSHLFYILTTRPCVQWVCVTRSEGSTLQWPALLYPPLPQRGGPRSPTPVRWRSQPHSFPACLPLMKPWRLGGAHLQTGDSRGWTDVTDCIML